MATIGRIGPRILRLDPPPPQLQQRVEFKRIPAPEAWAFLAGMLTMLGIVFAWMTAFSG